MADFNDLMKKFNSGKEIETTEGGGIYQDSLMKVIDVEIIEGDNEHPNPLLNRPGTPFLKLEIGVQAGEHKGSKFNAYQMLFLDDDGALSNPVRPSYQKKDGTTAASSLTYDILDAARNMEDGEDRFGQEFSKEQYEGLTFRMGLKKITRKDGDEDFILETGYQKLKDEEYRETKKAEESDEPEEKTAKKSESKENRGIDPDDLPF